jgi:diacylglycerol kinase family enzyme
VTVSLISSRLGGHKLLLVMEQTKRPVTVLWNVRSGWDEGEREAEAVCHVLAEVDPNLKFQKLDKGHDIVQQCKDCLDSGSQVLVAAGGDGTINAVASVLINKPAALGVIPAGTLNHFARDLAIEIDPEKAARQFADGHEVMVDVGWVNGRIFVNNSVLGIYPVYRAAREAYEARGLGKTSIGRFLAVLGGILRVFWRVPHMAVRLVVNGQTRVMRTPFVLIANNEHELEEWRIGRRTSLSKGHLWVYVMRKSSRWSLLRFFVSFILGRFSKKDAFEEFRVRELRIETRRKRIGVGVDGEIVQMQSPLEYRSLPKSLRVIAPSNYLSDRETQAES